jgi:hypothetical protein
LSSKKNRGVTTSTHVIPFYSSFGTYAQRRMRIFREVSRDISLHRMYLGITSAVYPLSSQSHPGRRVEGGPSCQEERAVVVV